MALPLPQVVESGDPVMNAMRGIQDYARNHYENQIKKVQARYAPLNTFADASSKLTYSNLMGPQFISKLLANPNVFPNVKGKERENLVNGLFSSGMQTNPIMELLQQRPDLIQQEESGGFSDLLKNLFLKNTNNNPLNQSQYGNSPPQQRTNAFTQVQPLPPEQMNSPNLSPEDRKNIGNMQTPGQSYVVQGNEPDQSEPSNEPNVDPWAKRRGQYEGTVAQETQAGKLRADSIYEYGKQYANDVRLEKTLYNLIDTIKNPTFSKMREKIPYFQDIQLKNKSKIGSREEQRLIGNFIDDSGLVLKDMFNSYRGKGLLGEFEATKQMKVNDNDTIGVLFGKVQSAYMMNQMNKQLNYLVPKIMKEKNVDEHEAIQIADKQINGQKIRDEILDKLYGNVTIEDTDSGERTTLPYSKALKKVSGE
jgi:hypothetical protein